MEKLNLGVLVIITDLSRNLFFLQQKDNEYWIPKFREKYCFFGGSIEPGENEFETLSRELSEELEKDCAERIYENSKKLFEFYFTNLLNDVCKAYFFESVVNNVFLKYLSESKVDEGRGVLVNKENLIRLPFFTDLEVILNKYLQELND